ncbi:hypothetical protein JOM56_005505 [Amanita muscaria]
MLPPVFQGDYAPVPATISLPRELVERIFLLPDIKSILTCRLINREFNEIIQSSTVLQYFLACKAAGVLDNPRSLLSYSERLEALNKWEDAWKNLKPVFETTIKVDHQPSTISIYALTGGSYFLDDDNLRDLHYCRLPSSPQDNPRWIRIPAHPGEGRPGYFVNFALSEYEHDLMINVISSEIELDQPHTQPQYSIDLVLLKFSTGEYHPLARHPRIHVQRSFSARPFVIPRIVGDNIALVVRSADVMLPDKLFIFDWKTGHKRLQHEATENAYPDLVFVSPEILLVPIYDLATGDYLVPNLTLSHFEVWHLPSHPNRDPPVQVLSLKIPAVSSDYSLFDVGYSAMPSPFLNSIPYCPPRPFFPSPEDSIIIANLRLGSFPETRNASYALIMHRCALLDRIKSLSLFEQQGDLPIWLANEVTVQRLADPDDGSVRLDAQSKLVSMIPHPRSSPRTCGSSNFATSPTSPTSHIVADSSAISSTTSSASRYNFRQVQWTDWGPPISRLFQVPDTQAQLIGTSAGQRYAFAVPSLRDSRKLMVSVADFNPYSLRRHEERMARLRGGEGEDNGGNGNDEQGKEEEEEEELEILDHNGVFSEKVYMGLKCVVYHAPDECEFDQLLMDEERLVGLKLDRDGKDESINVLYIG